MIKLYTAATPNGRKVSIFLEEAGLAYATHAMDIHKGDTFDPAFQAVNPNAKIPAIIDPDGPQGAPFTLWESGAILIYLAEKTQKFIPTDPISRYQCLQWLMFQMSGVGPIMGQTHHFLRFAKEDVPYAKSRYHGETKRIYGVMDRQLGEQAHIAGSDYTIADMATYPWVARHEWQNIDLDAFPNVAEWFARLGHRPGVIRGMAVPAP